MASYKRKGGRRSSRVYPQAKLSKGQRIFVTVMSIVLVTYTIIQLIKVNGI